MPRAPKPTRSTTSPRRSAAPTSEPPECTRSRILEAAGNVFAESGFREATVRNICLRAKVNIAAINYHFRSKDALHEAAMLEAHRYASERYPVRGDLKPSATPKDRLTAFVRAFVLKVMDQDRPSWHGRLMAREMIDPTPALAIVIEREIRPNFEYLISILADLAPNLSPMQRRMAAASVVGQCLHYFWCKEVVSKIGGQLPAAADWADTLTNHIVAFTLGGLPRVASIPLAATNPAKKGRSPTKS